MKHIRITSILGSTFLAYALMAGSLFSTQSASAQSNMVLAKVNIPFAFQTDKQTLPAGTYVINRQADHMIMLRGPHGAAGFAVTQDANRLHAADHSALVFARYGDKYFLKGIWRANETAGLEFSKGRAERLAVVATNKQDTTSVELAFNADSLE
jgi:hypothetical protein